MATYCNDPLDSPCIDAGDPNILDTERSDMGAYGGDNLGHPTGIIEEEKTIPRSFALLQNYPNPFNATTTIRYTLPYKSEISISLYNLLGQRSVLRRYSRASRPPASIPLLGTPRISPPASTSRGWRPAAGWRISRWCC
jgi:hypothetical protein